MSGKVRCTHCGATSYSAGAAQIVRSGARCDTCGGELALVTPPFEGERLTPPASPLVVEVDEQASEAA